PAAPGLLVSDWPRVACRPDAASWYRPSALREEEGRLFPRPCQGASSASESGADISWSALAAPADVRLDCQDCQAFARFLERPDVLDAAAGTDIFPMPTGRVKLTAGTDAVRCLCFSSKVFRWYTDYCRTPIGNTAGPRFPLVGLIHSFISHEADGRSRDEVLCPPLCLIYELSAIVPLPPNAPPLPSLSVFALRASRSLD